jgi:hypothetical protein
MTRDDIIEYSISVEESELHMVVSSPHSEYARINADGSCWIDWDECRKAAQVWDEKKVVHSAFAKLLLHVAAAEREACAKVCDEKAKRNFSWSSENADRYHAQADWAYVCAQAIRASGESK